MNGTYNAKIPVRSTDPTRNRAGEFPTATALAVATQSFVGAARFDYRLTDRAVWFASVESFQQNRNEFVRSPLSRNRFMVGFEFSLSSERDRRTNRLNVDEQYVALTDHARHRDASE